MSKPKEFWVGYVTHKMAGKEVYFASDINPGFESIHVIEYSAYLEKEMESEAAQYAVVKLEHKFRDELVNQDEIIEVLKSALKKSHQINKEDIMKFWKADLGVELLQRNYLMGLKDAHIEALEKVKELEE